MPVDRYYWQDDADLEPSTRLRALTYGFVWLLKASGQSSVMLASSHAELESICDGLSAALPLAAPLFAELKAGRIHSFDDGSVLSAGLYAGVSDMEVFDACLAIWADDTQLQVIEAAMVRGAICAIPRRAADIGEWIGRSAPACLDLEDLATGGSFVMGIQLPPAGAA